MADPVARGGGGSLADGPSLFDAAARARRFDATKVLLARIFIVARVNVTEPEQRDDLGAKCDKFLRERSRGGPLGGLVLVYPKHMIAMVEGCVDIIVPFVKFLQTLEKEGVVGSSRVLQTCDAARLLLQDFHFRSVNINTSKVGDSKPSEALDVVVVDCVCSMTKLCLLLASVPKASLSSMLDNLHESAAELLTSQGILEHLAKAEELDSLAAYLARYAAPVCVVLDNEIVWPYPVRLFPYE